MLAIGLQQAARETALPRSAFREYGSPCSWGLCELHAGAGPA